MPIAISASCARTAATTFRFITLSYEAVEDHAALAGRHPAKHGRQLAEFGASFIGTPIYQSPRICLVGHFQEGLVARLGDSDRQPADQHAERLLDQQRGRPASPPNALAPAKTGPAVAAAIF